MRKGVYERRFYRDNSGNLSLHFSYWDGKQWHTGFLEWHELLGGTPESDAARVGKSHIEVFEWRGVVK